MKKKLLRLVLIALSVMLLPAPAALADLERGDRGDGVAELQQLLFETGWLFELPDGIFGRNTEAAVRSFEQYAGLPADGVADAAMLGALRASLEALNGAADVEESAFSGEASALQTDESPVVLNSKAILDGDRLYYSGSIAGEGEGVYVMNAYGGDRRQIAATGASLLAVSDGNLLVWHYDGTEGVLAVLREDGTLENVAYSSNGTAIADGGRFYYGGSSVAHDGSDHQWMLSSDPEKHDGYWPMAVEDGYLYYMDENDGGSGMYAGELYSGSSALMRLNLETGEIDPLSGAGTRYIGFGDGAVYYVREDFMYFDAESGGMFEVEADEGMYAMDAETLQETKLASLPEDDLIYERYMFADGGVVYGERSDYSLDDGYYSIIRTDADGVRLPEITPEGDDGLTIVDVQNGVICGAQVTGVEIGEAYFSTDYILLIDAWTGEATRLEIPDGLTLFYNEGGPAAALWNGRVVCFVLDEESGCELLLSMSVDGGDSRTLLQTEPLC